ncbi:8-oxoguanine DNA glycosylase [Candidatus Poribacteria bacterium]|nr:MAG: 8-oxoguanine DNA glycosylase [Candidatus Poribacteria bacterium]
MEIDNLKDFSLKYTLESGQSFRWSRIDDAYYGVVEGRILKLQQENPSTLIIESSCNEDDEILTEFLLHYLDLNRDLASILSAVNVDAYIAKAIEHFWGMRVLNQELWETIASFILSQNNNISRIRNLIHTLAEKFGERVEFKGYMDYTFPSAKSLADVGVDEIFSCGTGYRAEYLWHAASKISNGELQLDKLKNLPYIDAKNELMNLVGVGEKVADCICLFSLGHLEALPIDVWIKRIFEQIYLGKKASVTEIRQFASNYFGSYIGYAQQYLFHFAQSNPNWADPEYLALKDIKNKK